MAFAVELLFPALGPRTEAFLVILFLLPGVWASTYVAEHGGKKDPQIVVIDEVLGQWIALGPIPYWSWDTALVALLAFRFFDIVKPYPIRKLERLPGGAGIVADDLLAGMYAAIVVVLVRTILWR